jgi:hypothetical protein
MSWLFSQVLVVEYLGESYLDGEPSVQLSGNNTQLAYLPQDKMTDYSKVSRFGMMFKPFKEQAGEELLMSYQAAFRAKTLVPQEKVLVLRENNQECGEKWQGSFAKYDQSSCLWKTHQCSLIEDWEQFSEIWPTWGSMRNGACWERQTLGLNTTEREFGLLPDNEKFFHTPTTGSSGGSNSRKAMVKRGVTWPTPTTGTGGGNAGGSGVRRTARENGTYVPSSINPNLQEWLMGWPQDWTEIKPLETDKYRKWRQLHGNY